MATSTPRSKNERWRTARLRVRTKVIRGDVPVKPSPPSGASVPDIMKRVQWALATHIIDVTGGQFRSPTRPLGRELLYGLTEIIFRTAIKEGSFKFPDGWGTFRVRTIRGKRTMRLPTGELVQLPPTRQHLKYEEGSAVRALLGRPQRTRFQRRFVRRTKLTERSLKTAKLSE